MNKLVSIWMVVGCLATTFLLNFAIDHFDIGGWQKAAYNKGYGEGYEEGKLLGKQLSAGLPRSPRDGGAFVKVACLEVQRLCLLKEVGKAEGSDIVMDFRKSEPWTWRTVIHAPTGSVVFLDTGTK